MRLDSAGFETILPRYIDAKEIVLDIRDVSWVYPDGAMAFHLLLKYRSSLSAKTTIRLPQKGDITSYMERMNCFAGIGECIEFDHDISEYLGHAWHQRDTMHQLIPVTHRTEVPQLVDKFVTNLDEQREISKAEKQDLTSCMVELFQNMPDHANPVNPEDFTGYVGLQSYENRNRIYLSIGDLGVGIRQSLMTREVYKLSRWKDEEAIEAVMRNRISRFADPDHSRGGGIRRAITSVGRLGGSILIRSGAGAVYTATNGTAKAYQNLKFFPGTQILVVTMRFVRR